MLRSHPSGASSRRSGSWQISLYDVLKSNHIQHVAYVPDAGHAELIDRAIQDPEMQAIVLTTEEEGIAYLAGTWLGGEKGVLLMQSSGVGNCVNMLSLVASCQFPLLTLVTMRGEWAEFNPWQIPMSRATGPAFELMGAMTYRAETANEVIETVGAAAELVFSGDQAAAVLISQKLLGKKTW